MTPLLNRIYGTEGGSEALDVLMKYLYGSPPETPTPSPSNMADRYKGMSTGSAAPKSPARLTPQPSPGFSQVGARPGVNEPTGAGMSVLLSWHEKLVEVAGLGCVVRCMTDFRRV